MDFGFSEEQEALRDLATKILRGLATDQSIAAAYETGDGFHAAVWEALAKAGLLGASLPESVGGGGMGLIEICLLLERTGDRACPIPLLPTLVLAGLPIARFGNDAQKEALLGPVVRGQSVLTAAVGDVATNVRADKTDEGWALTGTHDFIPALHRASRVLVPADTGGALSMFIVNPAAERATRERQIGTSEEPLGRLTLRGVRVSTDDVLGRIGEGESIRRFAVQRALVAKAAHQLGITRRALVLTAKYAAERHQFERPIGTFQAVAQRAGDAFIDVETIRLALWRAAWLLDRDQPAEREVAVASVVSSEAGHRVVCAAQHIHGGLGFDRDYPLFRYFLLSKQNEFTLGSAAHHLARLGDMIASEPLALDPGELS